MNRRLSRRSWMRAAGLTAGIVPLVGAVDGLFVTPRRLVTSALSFGSPGTRPVRLLQISDLHLRGIGGLETRLLDAVHEARADVIVFTGDMIDRAANLRPLEMLLRELPSGPRKLAIPGNWEYWCGIRFEALERTYERHDVQFLVNRSVAIDVHGTRIRITGLDDVRGGSPDAATALADAEPLPHHLVLAHCPVARDAVPLPKRHPASLILSGHTHGGQVAPLGIPLVRPAASGRYVAGWYRDDGLPPLYVSRGIGTSMIPVRIGSTPELVQIDWSVGGA